MKNADRVLKNNLQQNTKKKNLQILKSLQKRAINYTLNHRFLCSEPLDDIIARFSAGNAIFEPLPTIVRIESRYVLYENTTKCTQWPHQTVVYTVWWCLIRFVSLQDESPDDFFENRSDFRFWVSRFAENRAFIRRFVNWRAMLIGFGFFGFSFFLFYFYAFVLFLRKVVMNIFKCFLVENNWSRRKLWNLFCFLMKSRILFMVFEIEKELFLIYIKIHIFY